MNVNIETLDLPDDIARQYINARQIFTALRETETKAKSYRGSMLWRMIKGHTYLIRTSTRATQTSLGPKGPGTDAIYEEFAAGKKLVEERRAGLRKALEMNQRLNRALYVGRMDDNIIDILTGLHNAGLENNLIVVGTTALYAYETAAGVRIEERHLATNDRDLLWGNRRKLSVAIKDGPLESGLIGHLKRIDKTFELHPGQLYTAVNNDGFEVEIIRRMGSNNDNEPGQIKRDDGDFWAVRERNVDWLLSAPEFRVVVVGKSGRMAQMVTVDPRAFALHKLWMMQDNDGSPLQRMRDGNQAQVVINLVNNQLPQFSFDDIKAFPAETAGMLPTAKAE